MAGPPAFCIGDQLILEEVYDETYIPNDREILQYAVEIGIDPQNEPELMWLAREGIVASLPAAWKPCQDITGDIYYFNFTNGESTWDHPCDEYYHSLVVQERGKLLDLGTPKKKDRKKKKEKRDKGKEPPRTLLEMKNSWCSSSVPRGLPSSTADLELPLGSGVREWEPDNVSSLLWPPPQEPPLRTRRTLDDVEALLGRATALSSPDPVSPQQDSPLGFLDHGEEGAGSRTRLPGSQASEDLRTPGSTRVQLTQGASTGATAEDQRVSSGEPVLPKGQKPEGEEAVQPGPGSVPSSGPGPSPCSGPLPGPGPGREFIGPCGDRDPGPVPAGTDHGTGRQSSTGSPARELSPPGVPAPDRGLESKWPQGKEEPPGRPAEPAEGSAAVTDPGVIAARGAPALQDTLPAALIPGPDPASSPGHGDQSGEKWPLKAQEVPGPRSESQLGHRKGEPARRGAGPTGHTPPAAPSWRLAPLLAVGADAAPLESLGSLACTRTREPRGPPGSTPQRKGSSWAPEAEGSQSLISPLELPAPGEAIRFSSRDLQSPGVEDWPSELPSPRPRLLPQPRSPTSWADEGSESEGYSEDQRFYRHILRMVKISRQPEGRALRQSPGAASGDALASASSVGQQPEGAESKVGPAARRPEAGRCPASALSSGETTLPLSRSRRSLWQEETEVAPGRGLAAESGGRRCSEQAAGPSLAPLYSPPGIRAPVREYSKAPATLCGSQSGPTRGRAKPRLRREAVLQPQEPQPVGPGRDLLAALHAGKRPLSSLGFDKTPEDEDEESDSQTPPGAWGLLKNLHLDLEALGGGFEYQETPQTSQREEGKDISLNSDSGDPPAADLLLSHGMDGSLGSVAGDGPWEKPTSLRLQGKDGGEEPRPAATGQQAEGAESGPGKASDQPVETSSLKKDRKGDNSEESEVSENLWELQPSIGSNPDSFLGLDLGFRTRLTEHLLELNELSPAPDRLPGEAPEPGEEGGDQSRLLVEASQPGHNRVLESERSQSPPRAIWAEDGWCGTPKEPQEGSPIAGSPLQGQNVDPIVSPQPPEASLKDMESLAEDVEPDPESEPLPELEPELELRRLQAEQREEVQQEKGQQQQQEELRQKAEVEAPKLPEPKEQSLRALKEQLQGTTEEEEEEEEGEGKACVCEEGSQKPSRFRAQLQSSWQATEDQMRAEQATKLQEFREELASRLAAERASLEREQRQELEHLREELVATEARERAALEEEKEQALRQLRERLEGERKEAAAVLDREHAADLERLRALAEENHREVEAALEKQVPDVQQRAEDLGQAEQGIQQKAHLVLEYERELSDLLAEKRQVVEKDHERKMERLREEHQLALARTRQQYAEEERQQRAELLEGLRGELEQLRRAHHAERESVRQELDGQLDDLRLRHREQEKKLHDLALELETRTKATRASLAQLDVQEEMVRKKRQQLLDDEKQIAKEREEAAASRQHLQEARAEQAALGEATRDLHRAVEELRAHRADLESQVEELQGRSQRLQQQIRDLDRAAQRKQEALDVLVARESPATPPPEGALLIEDLQKPEPNLPQEPAVPPSLDHQDDDSSNCQLDEIRHLLSTEGVSLRSAKEFLARQTRSLRKRQAALKAAKQQWRHDLASPQGVSEGPATSLDLEDVPRSLKEETKHLGEIRSAMRQGQALLKKKEERLSQLESSLREELSDDNSLRGASSRKKVVTFDFSDLEDSSSSTLSSSSPGTPDPQPDLPPPQHKKIQFLNSSLQHITRELNGVLGVLGSLSSQQSPLFTPAPGPMSRPPTAPATSTPFPTSSRTWAPPAAPPSPAASLPSQWAWRPNPSLAPSAAQSVDSFLEEKWRKYFPAGLPVLSSGPAPLENKLGYVSASEQLRLLQHTPPRAHKAGSLSVQHMIEANKKWLEHFKKDLKVPLLSHTPRPSASPGILQLGLDETNQLKVYHS
ncbi:centrosomal protein of 164 kDa isoform X2 [Tachyglossus aculeatus]|uniref:centrosomal protein of 164 kDa isoform X2 n=1 Tax=Tachyglossus aculeatus TaxID=9261 RepID=UPI0018F6C3A5|nr:centrosomal protein of 164 kDa isoform X2 [Tachyglossus aculeatus]